KFALTLPHETPGGPPAQTDYRVLADLKGVVVNLPALRVPAQQVTGSFDLHNLEMRAPSLRGTILGGPFEVAISPGALGGDVTAAIDFKGRGRATGAPLPAFIGLPSGIKMSGSADWDLKGRVERHGDAADWPLRIDVASTLAGLEIAAPQPFTKAPADTRPTRVRLDVPSNGVNDVTVETGSARARLRFTEGNDGKWLLERGLARFDGQTAALPTRPGLLVAGDWPQFDLGEWLALSSGDDTGPRLSQWLGPVDVHLDRAMVAGFEFRDVLANLRFADDHWQVGLHGAMAEGEVTIPEDIKGGRPIDLQMQRLVLVSPPAVAGAPQGEPVDPRSVPALTVRADDFTWQGRRFGGVQAVIVKVPTGLRFDKLTSSAPSFTVNAQGSWMQEGGGSRTRLGLELASTDLAATSVALGYRESVAAKRASIRASVEWAGGPSGDAIGRMEGKLHLALDEGQLLDVKPGASGRMLGLMSVIELPRRLSLDFRDVTEKGLAFDKVRGDFDLRQGSAYTQNLILKGAVVDIGVAGRTGLVAEDYDQTIVVSGNPSGPLTVAAAIAGGPVGAASALVISQLFKGQLQGLTRAYYHVTGSWSNPVVERMAAPAGENAAGTEGKSGENP
ncbi:MAG TPA: AsmA-like C-terminal region-containing protein, partial [Steroidobacteraceae bacterium]